MSQGPFPPNPPWGGAPPPQPGRPANPFGEYPAAPAPNPYGGYSGQPQPAIPNPYGPYPGGPTGGGWTPAPKRSKTPLILGLVGGAGLLAIAICVGLVASLFSRPSVSASAKQPYDLASIALPPLPERGPALPHDPQVVVHETSILGRTGGYYTPPGHGGKLHIYLPPGQHPPQSLPCVLICAAGSTLLQGMSLGEIEEDGDSAEHFPYARAGIAVVAYELDGPSLEFSTEINSREYQAFRAACAGLVNARIALEFTLAKLPEVNPQQIFTAGHSSAGTAALLFAAHEPRLAGCLAYAPCTDLEAKFPGWQTRLLSTELDGLADFVCQSSPLTHVSRIRCPTLLFHAEDDSVCTIAETRVFASKLQAQGTKMKLITVPTGEHYDSMIEQGIPAGIQWIKQKTGRM